MKKTLFLLLIFLPYFISAQTVDNIVGFKSGVFGMTEASLINTDILYENGSIKKIRKKDEILSWGDVTFFEIDYYFLNNSLRKIVAHCQDENSIRKLIAMFRGAYGDYEKEIIYGKRDILVYKWSGNNKSVIITTFDDFSAAKIMFTDDSRNEELWNGLNKTILSEKDKKAITEISGK
jgi:hypothetical protein